jgi:hypothetical protein
VDATHFDRISKAFSQRRLSRRAALTRSGAGLAAGALGAAGLAGPSAAQEATPAATPAAGEFDPIEYLFVQSFESGTIAPKEGEDGAFTLTLQHGLGQTLYFSDRPARDVGATPTAQFLEGLGFSPSNPPNAALVVEPAPGQTDIAVVELLNPVYDPAGPGVTYEVKVLADWEDSLEMGFSEAPTDLAALAPSFGAAHLFIDGIFDCKDYNLSCCPNSAVSCEEEGCTCTNVVHDYGTVNYCSQYGRCVPCEPYFHDAPSYNATWNYWNDQCNKDAPACGGTCEANWWNAR